MLPIVSWSAFNAAV